LAFDETFVVGEMELFDVPSLVAEAASRAGERGDRADDARRFT